MGLLILTLLIVLCSESNTYTESLNERSETVSRLSAEELMDVEVRATALGTGDASIVYTSEQLETDFEDVLNFKASSGEASSSTSIHGYTSLKMLVWTTIDGQEALSAFSGLYQDIVAQFNSLDYSQAKYVLSDLSIEHQGDTLSVDAVSYFADGPQGPEGGVVSDCVGSFDPSDCYYAGVIWPDLLGGGVAWGGGPCDGSWEANNSNHEAAQTVVEDAINAAVPTLRPAKSKFDAALSIVYDDIECIDVALYPGQAVCDPIILDFVDASNVNIPTNLSDLEYDQASLNCAQCHITEYVSNLIPSGYVLTSISITSDGAFGSPDQTWFVDEYCFGVPRLVEIDDDLPSVEDLLYIIG